MAHQQQQAIRFMENYIIIWVDLKLCHRDSITDDNGIQTSITALRHIVNSIQLFGTCDECIDFIDNKVKHEKIFLIVSGLLGQQLVSQIEHDIKLDSIYIFCLNKCKHEQWVKKEQHSKIKGIFTNIQDICDQLKKDTKQCEHELTSIQILGSKISSTCNHLDASFMYSQLLKEILLSIEYDNNATFEQAKEDFMDFCRIHYAGNQAELCVIEEFKLKYDKPSPIWWYTRECFTYSMLNRALCTQDVEILIKMSFFICDLHRQLEYLHQTTNNRQILTVYRGQGMLHMAFNRMKQNQGGLISFNNFLSTSTSKEVSLCFAKKALKKLEIVAILFEMNIDPSISSVPFASLDKLSYFQENEKEILFSMHTVFRIGEIKPLDIDNNARIWHVYLTLTNANDEQLRQLTEHLRMDLSSILVTALQINMNPMWRLSKLLVNMGEYDKAITIYEIILDKATRDNNLEFVQATHYQLSELFMLYKNDWKRARTHLKKVFSIKILNGNEVVDQVKNDMITIFSTMRNLLSNEQIDENEFHSIMAELMYKLVTLYTDYSAKPLNPLDYQLIVDHYNYIGWVQKKQGRLSEAWTSHERAMKILQDHLPPTHPRFGITYNYLSLLYLAMNNNSGALICLEKALDIQEKALQPNHPHLAETHFYLSIVFERMNRIDDALQHAKKAKDIGRQTFLTSNDPQLKTYDEHFDKISLMTQSSDELVL